MVCQWSRNLHRSSEPSYTSLIDCKISLTTLTCHMYRSTYALGSALFGGPTCRRQPFWNCVLISLSSETTNILIFVDHERLSWLNGCSVFGCSVIWNSTDWSISMKGLIAVSRVMFNWVSATINLVTQSSISLMNSAIEMRLFVEKCRHVKLIINGLCFIMNSRNNFTLARDILLLFQVRSSNFDGKSFSLVIFSSIQMIFFVPY